MVKDPHLARDVTQSVFIALAQNSRQLSQRAVLSGWLHRTAQNLAANTVRSEVRRRAREQEAVAMNALTTPDVGPAWEQLAPHLDDAIGQLNEADRDVLLLRYFQRKSARDIAQLLGFNEEVAQKRVERALAKLRNALTAQGVAIPSALILTLIAAHSIQAAPANLAATVVASALAGSGAATVSAGSFLKIIIMNKLKAALITVIIGAGVATPLMLQHQAQTRLRQENQVLREELKQQAALAAENQRLSDLIARQAHDNTQGLPNSQLTELLRLRSEVGRLRDEARKFTRLKTAETQSPVNQLRMQLEQMPERGIPELQRLPADKWTEDAGKAKLDTEDGVRQALGDLRRAAKIRFVFDLDKALNDYLAASNGQLPNDISELKPYFKEPVDDATLQRYTLLQTGKASDAASTEPLISEKAPVDDRFDTVFKISAEGFTMQGVGNWSNLGFTNKWR